MSNFKLFRIYISMFNLVNKLLLYFERHSLYVTGLA